MVKKKNVFLFVLLGAVVVLSTSVVTAINAAQGEKNLEQTTTLQVSNLSCGSCLATIEGELRKNSGMVKMGADLSRGLVTVAHTPEFGEAKIAWIITEAGYPARVLSANELSRLSNGQVNGSQQRGGCGSSRGCGSGGCGLTPPVNVQNGPKS